MCIRGTGTISVQNISEISLSREMINLIGRMLGNEESTQTAVLPVPSSDGLYGEQFSEQLFRDGTNFFHICVNCFTRYLVFFIIFLLPIKFSVQAFILIFVR